MKKSYILFALIAWVVFLSSSRNDEPDGCGDGVSRKSAGPPSCYAGEPPNNTTCNSSGCHDDALVNSGTAQLHLDLGGADVNYNPGQQYTITVSLTRTGLVRGGFQLVALQNNSVTNTPGLITLTDTIRTQRIDAAHPHSGGCATQNKVWVEHTSAGIDNVVNNAIQWQFAWQAPSINVGSITFYLAATDANVDLDNTGDFVYTLSKTIAAAPLGIGSISDDIINIFPNPASTLIQLQNAETLSVSISNMHGETVRKQMVLPFSAIDISDLKSGIYFICDERKFLAAKFVKE